MYLTTSPDASLSLLDAALVYAALGWHVFPLRVRGKTPLIGKPQGGSGFHDATVDREQIEAWWGACPQANIGISTGPSGLIVIDLDGDEGEAAWRDVLGAIGKVTPTARVKTARGQHIYYKCPSGLVVPSSSGKGIDVRAETGYVLAPPSVHPSGHVYEWIGDEA